MSDYVYRPLDTPSKAIRLVRLERQPDLDPNTVVLRIRHARLADGEKFNALSYAWGDEDLTFTITIIDDTGVYASRVRRNLHDFLQTAKRSTDDWGQEWIWVDQICINQKDHAERCCQVSQMADLYPMAQKTIAWPGTLSTTTCVGKNQHKPMLSPEQLEDISHNEILLLYSENPSPPMRLLSMTSSILLVDVCLSPYWNRVWVQQEVALASKVYFLLLEELWDFDDVHFVVWEWEKHIVKEEANRELRETVERGFEILKARFIVWHQARWPRRDRENPERPTWPRVLQLAWYTECTEPLDKIYALMGLVAEDLRIYPDYHMLPRELLKTILSKQVIFDTNNPQHRSWQELYRLIICWSDYAGFERIKHAGWIPDPPSESAGYYEESYEARDERAKHNVMLVLEELGISIHPEHLE